MGMSHLYQALLSLPNLVATSSFGIYVNKPVDRMTDPPEDLVCDKVAAGTLSVNCS